MDLLKLTELTTDEPKETKSKKYKATAYIERRLRGAIDGIDTDDEALLNDFVWKNCQEGFACEIICNETGERRYAYPEHFNENTIGVEELIKGVKI